MRSYSSRLCSTSGTVSWISSKVTYPRFRPCSTSCRNSAESVLSAFSASARLFAGVPASTPDVACPLRGLGTDIQLPVEVLELYFQRFHALPVHGAVRVPTRLQHSINTLLQSDPLDPLHASPGRPDGIFCVWFGNQKSAQERDRRLVP